ncbi:MAG: winged helix DNA-binding protein, partial [Bdellovibrionales bacterium]|nr:winged helix DNA-binding protein [Bdellovibrionales bacterium]
HVAILSIISSSSDEINQNQLCEETGIDKASMVKIIDLLELQKLISRQSCSQDRRSKNIIITPKGEKVLEDCRKIRLDIEKQFQASLTESEIQIFKEVLLKILENYQNSKII